MKTTGLIALAAAAAALGISGPAFAQKKGGSLTVGLELDIPGFDPLKVGVYDTAGNMGAALIFETLVRLDANGKPSEAAAWKKTTASPGVGRWMLTASLADNLVTNRVSSASESWIYLGSGANAGGTAGVDELERSLARGRRGPPPFEGGMGPDPEIRRGLGGHRIPRHGEQVGERLLELGDIAPS